MKKFKKKYIIPIIAGITFIIGLACMLIPFLPFGWLLMAMTALLIFPYFEFMRKFLGWLLKKDKTGIIKKAAEKVNELYTWAGEKKRAKQINDFIDKANKGSLKKQPKSS